MKQERCRQGARDASSKRCRGRGRTSEKAASLDHFSSSSLSTATWPGIPFSSMHLLSTQTSDPGASFLPFWLIITKHGFTRQRNRQLPNAGAWRVLSNAFFGSRDADEPLNKDGRDWQIALYKSSYSATLYHKVYPLKHFIHSISLPSAVGGQWGKGKQSLLVQCALKIWHSRHLGGTEEGQLGTKFGQISRFKYTISRLHVANAIGQQLIPSEIK